MLIAIRGVLRSFLVSCPSRLWFFFFLHMLRAIRDWMTTPLLLFPISTSIRRFVNFLSDLHLGLSFIASISQKPLVENSVTPVY
jgi:hypothetical protein